MKKNKFVLTITATAALLFTSAGAINADAASIYPKVETKVFVYGSGNVNADQVNSYLQNYLNGFQFNCDQFNKQIPTQQATGTPKKTTTAAKPAPQTQQKAPTTQKSTTKAPTKSTTAGQPSTTKPAAATPASSQVSSFEQQVVI